MSNQLIKYQEGEIIPVENLPTTKQQAVQTLRDSPIAYWNSIQPKSVLDVFQAPNLSIVSLKNDVGEPFIRALMVKWMGSFVNFYSVNGTMSDLQVADTINLILEEYPHYKQDDFKLFFNMSKKGMFGQVFGRMDGEVIMQWLKAYDIHRDTIAQKESIKEAERFKPVSQVRSSGIYYQEYLKLKERAENGDKEAIEMLKPPK